MYEKVKKRREIDEFGVNKGGDVMFTRLFMLVTKDITT